MSYTLMDFLNGFHFVKLKKSFSANTQATYFSILWEFHLADFPSELCLSYRELKTIAGLKSVSTAHACCNVLKNNKLIDFKTLNNTTVYRLGTEHLPNTFSISAEHLPNGERTPGGLLNSPAHEAAKAAEKESSPRTPFKEKEEDPSIHHSSGETCAREDETVGTSSARTLRSPYAEANGIQAVWEEEFGYELRGNRALELERLAGLDFARAEEAIRRTRRKELKEGTELNDAFRYFKTVYDGLTPTLREPRETPKQKANPKEELIKMFDFLDKN